MRLFIAIDLPDAVTAELTRIQPPPTERIRVIPRHDIHLTLHFLGEAELLPISDALREITFPIFSLDLAGVGSFTARDRGIILWAGVEKSLGLQKLHSAIGDALVRQHVKLDTRPFSPHVTLARCKPNSPENQIDRFLDRNSELSIRDIPVMAFHLYSSQLIDNRHVYHCEQTFPLADDGTLGRC